jgi:glycolate oxidase FAD binding subunit
MSQALLKDFEDQIKEAAESKQVLRITGSGSKDWLGGTLKGSPLSTKDYQGVVSYQPDELVITVKAGTSLAEVEAILAEKNQQFAFEPPHFGKDATIGGMVCAGLAGPGRVSVGNLRDFVLGAKIMDGQGQVMNFGGTVMKNVAGYDVSRLMPGSLGTLALLLDVSIKVLPKPAATATLTSAINQKDAIHLMNLLASQPWPLSASSWQGEEMGQLHIRLNGAKAAVASAIQHFGSQYGMKPLDQNEADQHWKNLKEQQLAWFNNSPETPLWRFAVAPTSKPLPLSGETLIEWHGGQRWWKGQIDSSKAKQIALSADGHASIFRASDKNLAMLSSLKDHPLTSPLASIQDQLSKAFDPHGVFATGRLA